MKKGHTEFINLVYFKSTPPNFGDILSPFIIRKLSGCDIRYKALYISDSINLKKLIRYILHLQWKNIKTILFPWQKNLIGIGSIIAGGNRHSTTWGSGFISSNENFRGGIVCAVRGKYTNRRLKELGYDGASVLGDPALLLPLLVKPSTKQNNAIGIIPHMLETDEFKRKYGAKYKIIDLRTDNVEQTVLEITSCQHILSTSLHGIIVSHAYGLPALWIKSGKKIGGDDIKFKDYFSSVDIQPYNGFMNIDEICKSEQNWRKVFEIYKKYSLPNVDIKVIQHKLLNAAPFAVNMCTNNATGPLQYPQYGK